MRIPQRPSWRLGVPLSAVIALLVSSARADDTTSISRELIDIEGEVRVLAQVPLQATSLQSPTHVEERLTDGELFYRLHDYERSSIIFTDIIDNYPRHHAYPDALFLLGDSLFKAGDYLGARSRFRQILEHANESPFRPYVQRALGRLIEIAIRTRNFEGVEDYFTRLSRLPPSEVQGVTAYYRAKYIYSRAVPADAVEQIGRGTPQIDTNGLAEARRAFEAVPTTSPFRPHALYFIGVIDALGRQYPRAIESFRSILSVRGNAQDLRQVQDLARLALGRLYYETDSLPQAVQAYEQVSRTSSYFDSALYELAWVFIRQGDSTRAERALEVLAVASPESQYIPDAKLLRGNLLLRNGKFDMANQVFLEVSRQFGPVRDQLDRMIASRSDAAAFFRGLVRSNFETFDAEAFLPPLALRWVRNEGEVSRALAVLSDAAKAQRLVRETTDLIARLGAAIHAPNRANIFADSRGLRQRSVGLRNRLAKVRRSLIMAESASLRGASPELRSVRDRRLELERRLNAMPISRGDFSSRNEQALGRYRSMQRELRGLDVQLLGLEARVVAMDRFLTDTADRRSDPEAVEAVRRELVTQREGFRGYREQIRNLNLQIEMASVQVGVGDATYQRDAQLRTQHAELVAREHELLAEAGITRSSEIERMFQKVSQLEGALDREDARVDAVVSQRVDNISRQVDAERINVEGYRQKLALLRSEAEEVVGGIAYANFVRVRQRFYDLVLRADVGRVDVVWGRREEHRTRVDVLSRERARQLQILDDEFREITEEGQSAPSTPESGQGTGR